MKRKIAMLIMLCCVLQFTACDADTINNTVEEAGDKVGIDIDLNLEQEDLDKAEETVKGVVNTAKDVITDKEVRESVKDLVGSVKDSINKSTSEEEKEE